MTNDRIFRSFVDIDLRPMLILLGHVGVREDRFDRTLGYAGIAIDAGLSVDVEAVRKFMKCFDRTYRSTVGIFTVNA